MFTRVIEVNTRRDVEFVDITSKVEEVVRQSRVEEGIAVVFSRHTTTAVVINEAESGLLGDYEEILEQLIPKGKGYRHDRIDNNAHAHLRAMFLGNEKVIPVLNNRLALGTWQRVFLVELDGPRLRRVVVMVK